LRSSVLETNDLPRALKAVAEEFSSEGSAGFRLVVEGTARQFHPLLRDEVYRIGREALRNAFAHARARHIEAELTYGDRHFRMRIRDDGAGIDPDVVEAGRPGHYGLRGMRERSRRAGAILEIWSSPESGSEIDLRIPASIAYPQLRTRPRWHIFRKGAGS
jgi:signal transduction histidine kinase